MKTKIIPFDLGMAKKIQAREIKGRILNSLKEQVRIVCFDRKDAVAPIIALFRVDGGEGVMYVRKDGHAINCRDILTLEVLYNEPQFKPFDKVLVRDQDGELWIPDILSYEKKGETYRYWCIGGVYEQCIPYEGNEHLVGTTYKPNDK